MNCSVPGLTKQRWLAAAPVARRHYRRVEKSDSRQIETPGFRGGLTEPSTRLECQTRVVTIEPKQTIKK